MTTRDDIFASALAMFLRRGYDGTTLDAVAESVGVTKPAIYYHFSNKDELFRQLFLGLFEGMAQDYLAMLSEDVPVAVMLETMFASLGAVEAQFAPDGEGHIDFAYLPLMLDGARRFPDLREALDAFYSRAVTLISARLELGKSNGEVRDDLDSDVVAFALVAQFEGLLLVGSVATSCDYRGIEPGVVELFRRGMEPA